MFDAAINTNLQGKTTVINLDTTERERENALREQFANFWNTASGGLREVYDVFVSASPMSNDVSVERVNEGGVQGWWIRPARSKPEQTILYLHGGGYVLGSAGAYRGFVSQIVSRTKVPALVIDYPLAPESTLPSAPAAALAAWNWLVAQGCKQIAVVGDSAGGGLALVVLQQLVKQSPHMAPVAGVVFSPWTDLAFTGPSMIDPLVNDPLIGHAYLQDCARKYLGGMAADDALASPLFGEMRGLPPILVQVGTDERLLDDSRQFADRAMQAGAAVQLEIWEGMHHVFQLDVAHLASSRIALDHAAHFLQNAFDSE